MALSALGWALLVLSSSAAQAEVGAKWMLSGENITTSTLPTVGIAEIENKTGSLLTKIAGASVQVSCTAAELTGAKFEVEGHITAGSRIGFTGCTTKLNGAASSACKPSSIGKPLGTIETEMLSGLLVLHSGEVVIIIEGKEVKVSFAGLARIEPFAGTRLAVIRFGEECSLPEEVPVHGTFFVRDSKGQEKVELTTHLVEQGPLTDMYVLSDTAEHVANIDGSANVTLTGIYGGLKWSGLPG